MSISNSILLESTYCKYFRVVIVDHNEADIKNDYHFTCLEEFNFYSILQL